MLMFLGRRLNKWDFMSYLIRADDHLSNSLMGGIGKVIVDVRMLMGDSFFAYLVATPNFMTSV